MIFLATQRRIAQTSTCRQKLKDATTNPLNQKSIGCWMSHNVKILSAFVGESLTIETKSMHNAFAMPTIVRAMIASTVFKMFFFKTTFNFLAQWDQMHFDPDARECLRHL